MTITLDLTNVDPKILEYARERMEELQIRADYLTKVLGQNITVEDVIDLEAEED